MARKRKLNDKDERSIVARWKGGDATQAALAEEFGMSTRGLVKILRRHGAGGEERSEDRPKRPLGDPLAIADYVALGAPPADSLLAIGWGARALAVAAQQIMRDPMLSESARRRELRETLAAMKGMVPLDRLGQAEQVVLGDAKKLDEGSGPEPVDASPLSKGGRWATAKRGRS